jgi:hypothetical protein
MTKPRKIPYAEFRDFLQRLGYKEKRAEAAQVFQHPEEGLLVFRVYRDEEAVDERDLLSTRNFFELRGVLDPADFNSFLVDATMPA